MITTFYNSYFPKFCIFMIITMYLLGRYYSIKHYAEYINTFVICKTNALTKPIKAGTLTYFMNILFWQFLF